MLIITKGSHEKTDILRSGWLIRESDHFVTYSFRHSRGNATDLQDTAWKSDHFSLQTNRHFSLLRGGSNRPFRCLDWKYTNNTYFLHTPKKNHETVGGWGGEVSQTVKYSLILTPLLKGLVKICDFCVLNHSHILTSVFRTLARPHEHHSCKSDCIFM